MEKASRRIYVREARYHHYHHQVAIDEKVPAKFPPILFQPRDRSYKNAHESSSNADEGNKKIKKRKKKEKAKRVRELG